MRVNVWEGYKVCAPKGQKSSAQGFNQVSTLGNRHAKMRPESGARMKRRARMILIRSGAPAYAAPSADFFRRNRLKISASGHVALNCLTQG